MLEEKQKEYEAALRHVIEEAVDRKMKTPRDFDFLAEAIFEKLHQSLSASTLKRFWGYLPQYSTIRVSTLDLLAQFADYKDWDAFCQETQMGNGGEKAQGSLSPSTSSEEKRPFHRRMKEKNQKGLKRAKQDFLGIWLFLHLWIILRNK